MTKPSVVLSLLTFPKCAQIDIAGLLKSKRQFIRFCSTHLKQPHTYPLVQCRAVSTQFALIRVPAQKNLGPSKWYTGSACSDQSLDSSPTCQGISPCHAAVPNRILDAFLLLMPHLPQTEGEWSYVVNWQIRLSKTSLWNCPLNISILNKKYDVEDSHLFIKLQMIDDRAIWYSPPFLTSSCWWRPDGWHSNASLYHAHSVEEER